ncbi:MAG: hypothetical protein IPJ32_01710 [Sphingobacteriaceae bacterium]|nr:hypothetical protein [Sphingobacteriaceae bacterium]
MKKIFFLAAFIFALSSSYSQVSQSEPNEEPSTQIEHGEHFVIGLDKATFTQIGFIKSELAEIPRIVFSEFIYKDKILLIETDTKVKPYLTYADIEPILLKYINKNDIYVKEYFSFEELKGYYTNFDKTVIK